MKGVARIWLGEGFPEQLAPLLSTLGIEILSESEGSQARLRVEFSADSGRSHGAAPWLRIYRSRGRDYRAPTGFEASNVHAAASFIFSSALGLPSPLLAADEATFALIRTAARAAQTDSPIVVTGETGTGKELLVHMIHGASLRAGGMFSVNCAALNDTVAGGEGSIADSSATAGLRGLDALFAARDTTLFLDQIAELSPACQTWVLHALVRTAEAAGARSGARLVSATNRPLEPLVLSGEFRRDLHDRLAVLTITIPPLRERRAEIPLLANYFLQAAAPGLSFTPGAIRTLANYPFPGNVRELHNLTTRLAIVPLAGGSRTIHSADVRAQLVDSITPASIWKSSPFHMRREMAMQALVVCGGDRTAAARKLGISVRALQQHVISGSGTGQSRMR